MNDEFQRAITHTAEHIFMGSLKRLVPDLQLVKMEQSEKRNAVYVKSPKLNLDLILKAEKITNKIIEEGKVVKEHYFDTLEDAKRAFPSLRAIEHRIKGKVRVIEVDGYDYTACAGKHARNSKECGFFLVTSISKERDAYVIEFAAGYEAKERALELSKIALSLARVVGAPLENLEKAVENLKNENNEIKKRLVELIEFKLSSLVPKKVKGIKIYKEIFHGIDRKLIVRKAGELAKKDNSLVIFADFKEGEENAFISICKDERMKGINCGSLLRSALQGLGGKGGGSENFASGTINKDLLSKVIDAIEKEVENIA
jgi:alanyl-tRNA synthetase